MNDVLQFGGLYPHAKFQFLGWYWFSPFNNNNNLFKIPTSPKCFSVESCINYLQYSNNTIQCDTIRDDTIQLVSFNAISTDHD